MEKHNSIWSSNTTQVAIISATLFVTATLVSDFRYTLFPAHYANPDSVYSMIIRGICLLVICFFLIQFLLHRENYMQHLKNIVLEKKQPVYAALRIAVISAALRIFLNMVFPFNPDYASVFMLIWATLTAGIAFPLIIVAATYNSKK